MKGLSGEAIHGEALRYLMSRWCPEKTSLRRSQEITGEMKDSLLKFLMHRAIIHGGQSSYPRCLIMKGRRGSSPGLTILNGKCRQKTGERASARGLQDFRMQNGYGEGQRGQEGLQMAMRSGK